MIEYNYKRVITDNIKEWILMNGVLPHAQKEEWSKEDLAEWLNDELWAHDCITGNGPHGFAPEEKCQVYVAGNLTTYFEAAEEFCDFPTHDSPWIRKNPAQHMDATIRCYLLYECINQALEELNYDLG
jgi:hypothetical protein